MWREDVEEMAWMKITSAADNDVGAAVQLAQRWFWSSRLAAYCGTLVLCAYEACQ